MSALPFALRNQKFKFPDFQVQRYEGASTIFGQHSLAGYIEVFSEMAEAMALVRTRGFTNSL